MYAWIFRRLPGPRWLRFLLTVVLVAAVVWALFEAVFPWVAQFPSLTQEVTVGRA